MGDAETPHQRCERMLGELAELALGVARDLAARTAAAETPADAAQLATAFHHVSRSVRQSLALEARLERDRKAAEKLAAADATTQAAALASAERVAAFDLPPGPVEQRKARVRGALNRLIWDEAERDEEEFEILTADLDFRLSEAARREDFHALPIETLIGQIKADMGLDGPLRLTACAAPAPAPKPPATLPSAAYPLDSG